MRMLAPELHYVDVIMFYVSPTQLNLRSVPVNVEWVPVYIYKYKHMYVCIVMTVYCSALLTAKGWFGKLSDGKLRKSTYRFSVYHNE